MPYKHPTDRQAYRRAYYRNHQEPIKQLASEWYEDNRGNSEYKLRKSRYMIIWRKKKKEGM